MLKAIAFHVILAARWRRDAYAFLAGAAGALALAPFNLVPAIAVTFTIAVWLIDGSHENSETQGAVSIRLRFIRRAFRAGWWTGFGYFAAGLWWLGKAFLVEAEQFAWAMPLGVLGLPAGLAIFTAIGFAISALLWSSGTARIFALSFGIGVSEILRANLFTGFPWNEFGMALGGNIYTGQLASLVGLHGLTFITIALAAAPATAIAGGLEVKGRRLAALKSPTALAMAALALVTAWGVLRLSQAPVRFNEQVRLRIMQPNIPQDERFRPEQKEKLLAHYFELSGRKNPESGMDLTGATHLIWPESAFPFILTRDPQALARVGAFIPEGVTLVTGAARREDRAVGRRVIPQYFNSIQAIAHGGSIAATYDKIHLVPFGEYLPLASWLERLRLRQFITVPGGFVPGASRQPLVVPGLPPMAPLVCYEAIFPGKVIPPHREGARPAFLLNVTNDAWFGVTPGPYQHFAQARLRAIEEGMPLVRAANSGISAVVDAYGRDIGRLALGAAGVLDARLPLPVAPGFFAKNPLAGPAALACLALLLALQGALIRRRQPKAREF